MRELHDITYRHRSKPPLMNNEEHKALKERAESVVDVLIDIAKETLDLDTDNDGKAIIFGTDKQGVRFGVGFNKGTIFCVSVIEDPEGTPDTIYQEYIYLDAGEVKYFDFEFEAEADRDFIVHVFDYDKMNYIDITGLELEDDGDLLNVKEVAGTLKVLSLSGNLLDTEAATDLLEIIVDMSNYFIENRLIDASDNHDTNSYLGYSEYGAAPTALDLALRRIISMGGTVLLEGIDDEIERIDSLPILIHPLAHDDTIADFMSLEEVDIENGEHTDTEYAVDKLRLDASLEGEYEVEINVNDYSDYSTITEMTLGVERDMDKYASFQLEVLDPETDDWIPIEPGQDIKDYIDNEDNIVTLKVKLKRVNLNMKCEITKIDLYVYEEPTE